MDRKSSCDFCADAIAPVDFELGRAVTVMKKTYCATCLSTAIARSKRKDFLPEFLTPRPGSLQDQNPKR